MVDDDESIRLGDFGLSAVAENGSSYTSSSEGAWGWMAPELLDPETFGLDNSVPTRASDVYSFASVCIEVSAYKHRDLYIYRDLFGFWSCTQVKPLLRGLLGGY